MWKQKLVKQLFSTTFKNKNIQFKDKIKTLKEMKSYVIPFIHSNSIITKALCKSYIYLGFSKICFFGGPLFLKFGINGLQNSSLADPLLMFLGYGLCYSASVLFQSLRNLQTFKVIAVALNQTTQKAYCHLLKLDPQFFFSGPQRHRLYNLFKAQSALEQNLKAFTQYFLPIFVDIIMSVSLLLYYSGSWFVVSFLGCYGVYSIFTIKYSDWRVKQIRMQRQSEKQLDLITSQTFANYYNVKYFGTQKRQLERYSQAVIRLYQRVMKTQISLGVLNTMQRFIFGAGLTFNMILAAYYTQLGILSTGDIIMIQTLMLQFLNPLFFLGSMYRSFNDTFIDVKQLQNILQTPPKIKQGSIKLEKCFGNIKFNNVCFQYGQDNNQILKNLNFEVKENQFLVIVGPSGAGKSTILHLIFRLYDPNQGEILLDNHNIKDLDFSFRQNISFVSQSPYLFNGSILQNLRYANPESTLEQISQLAQELDLHEYIMELPQKYDTNVGQKGNLFSGGQKQRISLIRALLKKSKIILLDQPTSSLDAINEAKVGHLLQKYKNCTRIMITHRPTLMNYADRMFQISKL